MIIDVESEEELMHYGKKGMRWGVRREARVDAINRIGKGEGSFKDHLKTGVITKTGARSLGRKVKKYDERTARNARGTGNRRDKLRAALLEIPVDDLLTTGLRGSSEIQLARQQQARNILSQVGDKKVNSYLRSKEGRAATNAALTRLSGLDA
jgi:hypothetical protein